MALSRKNSEGGASDDRAEDNAPLERGEAALTPEDVHDRADAAETAATRPLGNDSAGSAEALDTHDHLERPSAAGATGEKKGSKP